MLCGFEHSKQSRIPYIRCNFHKDPVERLNQLIRRHGIKPERVLFCHKKQKGTKGRIRVYMCMRTRVCVYMCVCKLCTCVYLSASLSFTLTHTLSLSHSLSLSHTHTLFLTFSLSHFLSLFHTHTHTLSLTLSLIRTQSKSGFSQREEH